MTPEIGKCYRLRDGRKTGPVELNWIGSPYPFVATVEGNRRTWDNCGRFSSVWRQAPCDIVEVLL